MGELAKDFSQFTFWDEPLDQDAYRLLRAALDEDLGQAGDLTTRALIDPEWRTAACVVLREPGVLAGLKVIGILCEIAAPSVHWEHHWSDGDEIESGSLVSTLAGRADEILRIERTLLNVLGRLCGIATLTRRYVEAVEGTGASIYDTRKTTPGWRRLEKYAVKQGGGRNHRTGLFDAILIKDNHLAIRASTLGRGGTRPDTVADAVRLARQWFDTKYPAEYAMELPAGGERIVEVEVDTLVQFREILAMPESLRPDVVLLDNMSPSQLAEAVGLRNAQAPSVILEASGGAQLCSVRGIAESGVDRISVGRLTHGAVSLDLGLDW